MQRRKKGRALIVTLVWVREEGEWGLALRPHNKGNLLIQLKAKKLYSHLIPYAFSFYTMFQITAKTMKQQLPWVLNYFTKATASEDANDG